MSGFSLLGVDLSGAEYNPNGTRGVNYDYTYPTHAEIDYFASKGMTAIRLPFLLERLEPVAGGPLDATQLGYIDDVVNYAASKGIDVILDPHNYGYEYGTLIGSTAASNATFANFWGELAGHYASTSNVLFGLMNEPSAQSASQWIVSVNAAIAAIRASGAISQQILVPGTYWDGGQSWTTSDNATVIGGGVVDPSHNFAFEVHQYLDSDNSGTHASVVSTTIGVDRLTAITAWAEATGNKLFLGEFGVSSDATSLTALNNMLNFMAQHTDVWEGGTYWAAGPWLGAYAFSIEPSNGVDKPQMSVLDQYAQSATIEANGSTSLVESGGHYFLNSAAGSGPMLQNGGAAVTAGQSGGWSPLAVEQAAAGGGYQVVFKVVAADQYTVWNTDSNGNFVSDTIGVVSGSNFALASLEATFHQDLNGDGVISPAPTVIEVNGSTSLTQLGNNFYLCSGGAGPQLKDAGVAVVVGQFGGWTPIGAEQTAAGYEVAWQVPGSDQYTVWNIDSNGNFGSNIGTVSGSSYALESLEASFHQDLNGDGVIGLAVAANATLELNSAHSDAVTFTSSTGTLQLDNPSTFTGQIVGYTGDGTLAGSDHVDLLNMGYSSSIQTSSTYTPSAGTLTVSNGTTVDVLNFVGNYSQSNFKFASDGHGGTIVYDPPAVHVTDSTTINGNGGLSGSHVIVDSGATLTLDHAAATGNAITNNGTVKVAGNSTVNVAAGSGQDNFVFAGNFGQATLSQFKLGTDILQIDHAMFANVQALLAATHDDSHGHAVITDAAHDTITIQNVTTAQLLAHQSGFHLV
jgi:endoglucanase